jgi:glycosyltransferase involved in cell wall biosynthesis/SAM-dependent methyltransferase
MVFPLVKALRGQLSSITGTPVALTWCLRMDPQITEIYGAPDWIATVYRRELAEIRAAGDVIGLHPHSWRWRDGWVSDQGDGEWVAHCVRVALDTYFEAFGAGCHIYRHGDGFMSNGVAQQIEAAGVQVDLTLEPGLPARTGLLPEERATGGLPDTQQVPHRAYWPSRDDFRVPDPTRTDRLLMVPLTPGLSLSTRYRDRRLVPTGTYERLSLWTEPGAFARMLRTHLRQPVSHVAFALRSDIGLRPTAWANVERNVRTVTEAFEGQLSWCTALEARDLIVGSTTAPPADEDPSDNVGERRASLWLQGEDDAGYRARAEPEAFDVLMWDGGSVVERLRALGAGSDPTNGSASSPIIALDEDSAGPTPARSADPPPADLEWVSEDCELSCPVCGRSVPGHRFAVVTSPATGGRGYGIGRCSRCQTIVPELFAVPQDLPNGAIDERVEFIAGVDAVLLTLMRVQKRRDLRLLDIGCGYGFALDLARFAWGWEGIGVDPANIAYRGREELGVDIRTTPFDSDLDLGSAPFDVVLASETLEHVPDPRALLGEIKDRLAPDGVLVMSTPNAQLVTPATPAKEVVAALGLGSHMCLVDRKGLERLLRDAGFGAVEIEEAPLILRAVASPTVAGLTRCAPASTELDLPLLARYCDARADSAPEGSALRLGMAIRCVQYALHAGDLAAANAGCERLRAALLDRYGIDVEDPEGTSARALQPGVPLVAAAAHFNIGFLELEARHRPARAAIQFAAAAAAANSVLDNPSPAPLWLQLRAIGHEALAYARSDPSRAPGTLRRLRNAANELVGVDIPEVEGLCVQVYDELVAGGHFDAADAARSLIAVTDTDAAPAVPTRPAISIAASSTARHSHGALRVSAIIPLYNGARHLSEAVASVVKQTRPPDELVVVDDGSTDNGIALLQTVSAPFPIRFVRQKRAGQSVARNRGVTAAAGDLLAFLDQDDTWHADHLQVLCRPFTENATVGWVYGDFDEIDAAGQTVTLSFLAERAIGHPRRSLEACLGENLMVIPSASVIRRTTFEALGGFDDKLQGYEDDDLYVRAFRRGTPMVFEPKSLTCFRVHPTSSSANGRFAESRLHFAKKLRQTVTDDARLNRYYFRDVIAPRFFHESLDDYVRAVSDKDWGTARRRYDDMEYFARLHRDHAALRWKMTLVRNPELFRWVLQASDSIPVRPRSLRHPLLRLRHRFH